MAINYLPDEQEDADETRRHVEKAGRRCLQLPGDLEEADFCRTLVEKTVQEFGKLDILVSNAAHQDRKQNVGEISDEEWRKTFRTNIDALFYLSRAAMKHLKPGGSIIVTSSETGLFGNKQLLDYSFTKGAINAFVKALAQNVVGQKRHPRERGGPRAGLDAAESGRQGSFGEAGFTFWRRRQWAARLNRRKLCRRMSFLRRTQTRVTSRGISCRCWAAKRRAGEHFLVGRREFQCRVAGRPFSSSVSSAC